MNIIDRFWGFFNGMFAGTKSEKQACPKSS